MATLPSKVSDLKRKWPSTNQGSLDAGENTSCANTGPLQSRQGDQVIGLEISSPVQQLALTSHSVAPNKRRKLMQSSGQTGYAGKAAANDMASVPTRDSWVLQRQMTANECGLFKETVTENFSTRIIYKHNELRLIDQEIAKCQVALEQLRRCSEIPFPSITGNASDMAAVSAGTGTALLSPDKQYPPLSTAPWGVTNGAYTRHYAQWLLQDRLFSGGDDVATSLVTQGSPELVARSRGVPVGMETMLPSGRSRTHRGSAHAVLQSLPSGYAQPKPQRSAQIIKRHSDGMFVKLVCPGIDCGEERFNSVQGFINHCRIKHQIHFATHEDAAQKAGTTEGVDQGTAGQTAEPDSATQQAGRTWAAPQVRGISDSLLSSQGAIGLEENHRRPIRHSPSEILKPTSPSTPRAKIVPASTTQAISPWPSLTTSANVNPYNRNDLDTSQEWPRKRHKVSHSRSPITATGDRQRRQSDMGPPISPAFVASDSLPFLSERFAHAGKSGDLQAMVDEARNRFDLENITVPEETSDTETTPVDPTESRLPKSHETVGGLGAPLTDRRPASGKGLISARPDNQDVLDKGDDRGGVPFLANTPGRPNRDKSENSDIPSDGASARNDPSHHRSVAGHHSDETVTPPHSVTSGPDIPDASTFPIELSPGAHRIVDANQAPSLVSDDGQSGSDFGDGEDEDDMPPKSPESGDQISFDATEDVIGEAAGSNGLDVHGKASRWNARSKSSRTQ